MDDFLALFHGISGWSLGWVLAAFLFALTFESWPHLRYSYWQWRIDRLLGREEVHPDDIRDLHWRQNEKPEPFDFLRVLYASFQMSLQLALPVILVDVVSADDLSLAPAAVAAVLLFSQNKERAQEDEGGEEPVEPGPTVYPREAKIGFAFALLVSTGLFLYISQVMQPG
ncbi:hypothetical protein [Qipengyuania gelatinilytica]|uniref:Uncharacterized protein n=1 Tax=Qipengyuania gelatinilytica TaxID=2867231 RepID=A0ABX8ZYS8_9SPHN|nr:hypothetical protein [Qipengyuania gelatinilytica]QZD93931.1 hypothetical protein K3136_07340 [Qipengyuania gelatinilytica]